MKSKAQAFSANANELDSRGAAGILQLNRKNNYKEWIQGKPGVNNNRLGNQANDGYNQVIENQFFAIYPNPSNGVFYYNYNNDAEQLDNATLEVYDMRGQLIISGTVNASNAKGMIDLSNVSNGMYFVKIATTNKLLFNAKISVIK